jgi:tRNA A-37 threonylcarbamoyl transferase component Bud32
VTDKATKARRHDEHLAAVRGFLRTACDASIALDGLEATYLRAGADGPARVLYEIPGPDGHVLRLAARRLGADRGRSIEATINARSSPALRATGFARAALYAPALDLLFQVFPSDDGLPSLPVAVDGTAMAPVLSALLGDRAEGARLTSVTAHVMRYKPGRKCLLRYDLAWDDDGPQLPRIVWARVARQAKFDRSRTNLARLYDAALDTGFELPRPLGAVPELAIECFGPVPGVALSALTARDGFTGLCRQVGEAIRRFHALELEMDERFDTQAQAMRLAENAAEFAWLMPAAVPRIRRLADAIAARLRDLAPSPATVIHRDFHGDNILVDGAHLALVDFEDCAMGDAVDDVGTLWAQLRWQSYKSPDRSARIALAREKLLSGYLGSGEALSAARLTTYVALHCLLYAHQCLRHLLNSDREEHAAAMLAACEAALEGDLT